MDVRWMLAWSVPAIAIADPAASDRQLYNREIAIAYRRANSTSRLRRIETLFRDVRQTLGIFSMRRDIEGTALVAFAARLVSIVGISET